jgi:serine/threonine-protein kinase
MEYLEGQTLRAWLARPRTVPEVLAVFGPLLEGLAFAHARGVVHRDIKPENIFLTARGQVKVLDLGMAGLSERPRTASMQRAQLPMLGVDWAGTPRYWAPEIWQGTLPTARVDVWALGVMLYEALAGGRHPIWGDESNYKRNVKRVLDGSIPPLPPQVPPGLARLTLRALAREPQARFADAGEFAAALQALYVASATVKMPAPRRARRHTRLAVAVGIGCLLLALLALLTRFTGAVGR